MFIALIVVLYLIWQARVLSERPYREAVSYGTRITIATVLTGASAALVWLLECS